MSKILKFDNILNVRDFGSHELPDGTKVSAGKLFRGAQLSKMTEAEQGRFDKFGVSLVVDLRYLTERRRQASKFCSTYNPDIFEFSAQYDQDSADKLAPHEAFAIRDLNTAEDAYNYMLGSYEARPLAPGFVDIVSRSLKRMAGTGEGIYVHCAAGKDRTGTFAAIVLMLLGVSKDEVMDEYLRTRQAMDLDLVIDMITLKMEQRYGRKFSPEALRPYFDVETQYLQKSLDVIGDIGDYARNVLKLGPNHVENLRKHYRT
ncbi:MAG: tyrosine-protein phosphatase [Robiginitomaculum sp.]|nr:tyrosine-protein phosphatase [Robiginitomaculum sp.]